MKSKGDAANVQRGAQQNADLAAAGGGGGPSASGAQKEPIAETAAPIAPTLGRDRSGRFLPAHRENIVGGRDSDRLPAGLEYLQADLDRFIAGSLSDEGDLNDIPTRRRAQLEYRARLHRRILQLDSVLDQRGLIDKRGKLRVAWLSQLQTLIAAAVRIDNLLGLDRHPKDVDDLQTYLAQQQQRDDQQGGSEHEADSPARSGETRTEETEQTATTIEAVDATTGRADRKGINDQ